MTRSILLSPEASALVAGLASQPMPAPYPSDPADLAAWDAAHAENEALAEAAFGSIATEWNGKVYGTSLAGVGCLKMVPAAARGAPVLYLHGGGYTFYSAHSARFSAIQMAQASNREVYALDFTPAPHGTCTTITAEIVAAMSALRGLAPAGRFGVYGESAGGGLAIAATLRAIEERAEVPTAIVAFSPWADLGGSGASYRLLAGQDPAFTYRDHLARCAAAYAGDVGFRHPWASPVFGTFDTRFPATLIQGGTRELLLSDFVRLHQAMREARVQVDLLLQDGLTHCFPVFFHRTGAAEAVAAYAAAAAHWSRHLDR